ncbi:MAG: copper-binding protein, partial [Gammaproteobacteria bacterium]
FGVADPALLEGLNESDEVRFAIREGEQRGQFVITAIEPVE